MTPKEIYSLVLSSGSDRKGVFGGDFTGGANIQQVPDEIAPCLYFLYMAYKDKKINYLEIGAASGGLTYLVSEVLHPQVIILVDDNGHTKSKWRPGVLNGVERKEIIGDSQSETIVQVVKNLGILFELVVIDADHTYRGVTRDIANYKPLCSEYLLLHDTIACKGVQAAFEELKEDESFEFVREFITASYPRPCGLGLFRRSK